jgi:hypothetical protein
MPLCSRWCPRLASARTAGHGQDGWLGTGCGRGWGGLEGTDSNAMRAVKDMSDGAAVIAEM